MTKNFGIVFLSLCILQILFAQTGMFVYDKSFLQERPNLQIVDIGCDNNFVIYVLGEAYDEEFQNPYPWIALIDGKNGSIIQEAFPVKENTEGLLKIFITRDKKIVVYGNCIRNDKVQPYFLQIEENLQIKNHFLVSLKKPQYIAGVASFTPDKNLIALNIAEVDMGKIKIGLAKIPIDMFIPSFFTQIEGSPYMLATDITLYNNKIILAAYEKDYNENIKPVIYCMDTAGKVEWTFNPSYNPNFNEQFVRTDNNSIYILTNYKYPENGTCNSSLIKLNKEGKKITEKNYDGYKFNGLQILKNGKIILYGMSYLILDDTYLTSTGVYMILNENLETMFTKQVGVEDLSNQKLKETIKNNNLMISSELNAGIELLDGRIALGGRFYMPDIANSAFDIQFNRPMIILLTKDGKLQ